MKKIKLSKVFTEKLVEIRWTYDGLSSFIDYPMPKPITAIKDVIFEPPYTRIIFKDGQEFSAKCAECDNYDEKIGFSIAFAKAQFGSNGNFNRCLQYKRNDVK